MIQELSFLLTGAGIGLAAGISPGPLSTCLISQTLKHGFKEGLKGVVVPPITDIPIIIVSLFILSKIANANYLLGIISIAGALFLGYLAYDSLTIKKIKIDSGKDSPKTITKAIITNFLNPNPYIFFFTVGSPTLIKAYKVSLISPVLFLIGFFGVLISSLIILVIVSEKFRGFLTSKTYIYTIKALGLLLLYFGFVFLKDGLKMVGVI